MLYKQYHLDRFQEEAIKSIEQDHSVIVAAPTGAGKTLVAEYAAGYTAMVTNPRVREGRLS